MTNFAFTSLQLSRAANYAHTARFTVRQRQCDMIAEARRELIAALAASDTVRGTKADLVELVAQAIIDNRDIDIAPEAHARAVVDAILDHCLPYQGTWRP